MNSLLILEGTPGRYEIEGQVFYGCCTKIVFNAQEEHWLYLLSVHSIIESLSLQSFGILTTGVDPKVFSY